MLLSITINKILKTAVPSLEKPTPCNWCTMSKCLDIPEVFSTGNAVIANAQMWVQTKETSALLWEKNKVPLMHLIKTVPSTILENPHWISLHEHSCSNCWFSRSLEMLLTKKVSFSRFLPWEVIVWTWMHCYLCIYNFSYAFK